GSLRPPLAAALRRPSPAHLDAHVPMLLLPLGEQPSELALAAVGERADERGFDRVAAAHGDAVRPLTENGEKVRDELALAELNPHGRSSGAGAHRHPSSFSAHFRGRSTRDRYLLPC